MDTDDTKWWSAQLQNMLNDKANDALAVLDKAGASRDEAESYVLSIRALQDSLKCATTPDGEDHTCEVNDIMQVLSGHGDSAVFAATGLWATILRNLLDVPDDAQFSMGVVDRSTTEMVNPDEHGDRHAVAGTRILVAHLNGQHATARDLFKTALEDGYGEMALEHLLWCATGMLLEAPLIDI